MDYITGQMRSIINIKPQHLLHSHIYSTFTAHFRRCASWGSALPLLGLLYKPLCEDENSAGESWWSLDSWYFYSALLFSGTAPPSPHVSHFPQLEKHCLNSYTPEHYAFICMGMKKWSTTETLLLLIKCKTSFNIISIIYAFYSSFII